MIKILLVISVFLVAGALDLRLLYVLLGLAAVGLTYYSIWVFGFRIANSCTNTFATAAIKSIVISITFSPDILVGKDGIIPAPAAIGLVLHESTGFDTMAMGNAISLFGVWFIATVIVWLLRKKNT
jgi:hypothetical protein